MHCDCVVCALQVCVTVLTCFVNVLPVLCFVLACLCTCTADASQRLEDLRSSASRWKDCGSPSPSTTHGWSSTSISKSDQFISVGSEVTARAPSRGSAGSRRAAAAVPAAPPPPSASAAAAQALDGFLHHAWCMVGRDQEGLAAADAAAEGSPPAQETERGGGGSGGSFGRNCNSAAGSRSVGSRSGHQAVRLATLHGAKGLEFQVWDTPTHCC